MARYWVGGSGNWSDSTNHWSTSSGGTPGDVLGGQLLLNGSFSGNANNWDLTIFGGSPWAYDTNKVTVDISNAAMGQNFGAINGKKYSVEFDYSGGNGAGALFVGFGTFNVDDPSFYSPISLPHLTNGHYSGEIVCSNVGGYVIFYNAQGWSGSVTNVSVKEVLVNVLPTSSDNVFIDSNSGLSGGTITFDGNACNNFTSTTGINYTINNTDFPISIYGSFTGESGLTITSVNAGIQFWATSPSKTIATKGGAFSGYDMEFNGVGGGWTLQDNLAISGEFYQENGTFDANGHNITANDFYFYADQGFYPVFITGTGTFSPIRNQWTLDENNGAKVTILTPPNTHFYGTDY